MKQVIEGGNVREEKKVKGKEKMKENKKEENETKERTQVEHKGQRVNSRGERKYHLARAGHMATVKRERVNP